MIEIKDVCKRFDQRVIFDCFSCTIKQGDFVIFGGESGKGKTTLLNMIGGVEPMDSGEILINGLSLNNNKNIVKLYRDTFGFLFQNFALVEKKTVKENLEMIDPQYRSSETVSSTLAKVGLGGFENNKIYTLSGGEQQRVSIARLLLKQCNIVLADEPTGSLDHKNRGIIINHLKEINALGKTIIMVTHDDEIKKLADYVVEL